MVNDYMNNTLLILPCHNEAKNLIGLLDEIRRKCRDCDVLVVNDCSTDCTPDIARKHGARLVNLSCNLGIGGAVQAGYRYAYRNNYDYAIQVDGDGQHDPSFIPLLLEQLDEGYNMSIGSRFIEKSGFQSTVARRIGIKFFRVILLLLTKKHITDATSGFRAADRRTIKLFAENYPTDYPEPETIVMLLRNGFMIKEVPVIMRERESGISSISALKSVYYMVKVTLAMVFAYFKKPRRVGI